MDSSRYGSWPGVVASPATLSRAQRKDAPMCTLDRLSEDLGSQYFDCTSVAPLGKTAELEKITIQDYEGDGKDHPDAWKEGRRFAAKTLNTKKVSRAQTPDEVLRICAAHNLRQHNEHHRHRYPIDSTRTHLNRVLRGPSKLEDVVELASATLQELGIAPRRSDAIMGIELVFQDWRGLDAPVFWEACLEWVASRYDYILSAVVHVDQLRPHMHVIVLPIADGRLQGNVLSSRRNKFTHQRRDFLAFIEGGVARSAARASQALTELAVSCGRGAKTHAAALRRDQALDRLVQSRMSHSIAQAEVGAAAGALGLIERVEITNPLIASVSPTTSPEVSRQHHQAGHLTVRADLINWGTMKRDEQKPAVHSDVVFKAAIDCVRAHMETVKSDEPIVTLRRVLDDELVVKFASGDHMNWLTQDKATYPHQDASAFNRDLLHCDSPPSAIKFYGFVRAAANPTIDLYDQSTIFCPSKFGQGLMHQLRRDTPQTHDAIAAVLLCRVVAPDGNLSSMTVKLPTTFDAERDCEASTAHEPKESAPNLNSDDVIAAGIWRDVMKHIEADRFVAAKGRLAGFLAQARGLMQKTTPLFSDDGAYGVQAVIERVEDGHLVPPHATVEVCAQRDDDSSRKDAVAAVSGIKAMASYLSDEQQAELRQNRAKLICGNFSWQANHEITTATWSRSASQPGHICEVEAVDCTCSRNVNRCLAATIDAMLSPLATEDNRGDADAVGMPFGPTAQAFSDMVVSVAHSSTRSKNFGPSWLQAWLGPPGRKLEEKVRSDDALMTCMRSLTRCISATRQWRSCRDRQESERLGDVHLHQATDRKSRRMNHRVPWPLAPPRRRMRQRIAFNRYLEI